MITIENIKEVLNDLNHIDVQRELDKHHSHVAIHLSVFSEGSYTTIESTNNTDIHTLNAEDHCLLIDKTDLESFLSEGGLNKETLELINF